MANGFAHAKGRVRTREGKGSHTRRVRVPCPTVYLSHRSSLLTYLICFPFASEAIRRQPPFQDKANAQHDRERSFLKASCSRRVRVVLSSLAFRADANGKLMGNTIAACLRAGGSFLQARRASFSRLETNIDQAEVSDRAICWHRMTSMPIVIGGLSSSSVGDHHITTLQAHIITTNGSQFFQYKRAKTNPYLSSFVISSHRCRHQLKATPMSSAFAVPSASSPFLEAFAQSHSFPPRAFVELFLHPPTAREQSRPRAST